MFSIVFGFLFLLMAVALLFVAYLMRGVVLRDMSYEPRHAEPYDWARDGL